MAKVANENVHSFVCLLSGMGSGKHNPRKHSLANGGAGLWLMVAPVQSGTRAEVEMSGVTATKAADEWV